MKKYSIFLMAALALGFTACDDVQDVVSVPQTNPQETIMTADGVTVAPGATLAGGAVNLQDLKDNAADAAVLELVKLENFPSKATAKVVMEISATDDFAAVQELATEVIDSVAYVAPADWQAAHLALYGKNPMQRTSYVRYALYAEEGSSVVRIGYDAETKAPIYYGAATVLVTPFDPAVWIESAYYVAINGVKDDAKKMAASGDVFDNPVFSTMVTVAAGDKWQILPMSAMQGADVAFGPEVEDAKNGALVEGTSGVIAEAGDYVITVNMEEKTYKVAAAIEKFYVAIEGKSIMRNYLEMMADADYANYSGYIFPKDGALRFYTAQNLRAETYGMAADAVAKVEGSKYTVALEYPSSLGVTLGLPKASMPMWANVNVNTLTLEAYTIESIGIIGDATPTGWDGDTDLTTTNNLVWKASDVVLKEGSFKFRANDAWDADWGGTIENVQYKGANIAVTADMAGTYDITLDFSKVPYTCTLTKK